MVKKSTNEEKLREEFGMMRYDTRNDRYTRKEERYDQEEEYIY